MDFTNEELYFIYNRISNEKEKLEQAIERKFIVSIAKDFDKEGVQIGASAKPLSDLDVQKIKDSTFYTVCTKLQEKLKPIADIIIDADDDVKHKFEKYL